MSDQIKPKPSAPVRKPAARPAAKPTPARRPAPQSARPPARKPAPGPESPAMTRERILMLAATCHFGGVAGYAIPFIGYLLFPFCVLVIPLVLFYTQSRKDEYIYFHAREALNFHLNLVGAALIAMTLMETGFGWMLLGVAAMAHGIYSVKAGIAVMQGQDFVYPYVIRFINPMSDKPWKRIKF